jgi:hypothetical protein
MSLSISPTQIKTSTEDFRALSERGLTAEKVINKLAEAVDKAQRVYNEIKEKNMFQNTVSVDGCLVTVPIGRERGSYGCKFCEHITFAPGEFEIENIKTKAKVTFDEHTLHMLKSHYYFGQGKYWLNPTNVCDVLEIS